MSDAIAEEVGRYIDNLKNTIAALATERDTLKQQLDSYFADRDKSPWKSVDDPPKKSGVYLVIEDDVYYIAEYDACGKEWHSEERYTYLIPTHWTEIPDLCL